MHKVQPLIWTQSSSSDLNLKQIDLQRPTVVLASTSADVSALQCERLLSPDEFLRSDRLRSLADRKRFTIGRMVLRMLLAEYLNVAPAAVPLRYGAHGKPSVDTGSHNPPIHFNLAHSGELILVAFHKSQEIGVDIERIHEEQDWGPIARQILFPSQYEAWCQQPVNDRNESFFREWTRRESGLKSLGCGFAVEMHAGWDTQLCFQALDLPVGYAGCVAMNSAAETHAR